MQGKKEKPQVFIINKGSNFLISVQFAFNGQKGWRLWKQGRNKPISDHHSTRGQKSNAWRMFWITEYQTLGCVKYNQKLPQKIFFTAKEHLPIEKSNLLMCYCLYHRMKSHKCKPILKASLGSDLEQNLMLQLMY